MVKKPAPKKKKSVVAKGQRKKNGRGHASATSSDSEPELDFDIATADDMCNDENIWGGIAKDVPPTLQGSAFGEAEKDYLRLNPLIGVVGALLFQNSSRHDVALCCKMLSSHVHPHWVFDWRVVVGGADVQRSMYSIPGSLDHLTDGMLSYAKVQRDNNAQDAQLAWVARTQLGEALVAIPRVPYVRDVLRDFAQRKKQLLDSKAAKKAAEGNDEDEDKKGEAKEEEDDEEAPEEDNDDDNSSGGDEEENAREVKDLQPSDKTVKLPTPSSVSCLATFGILPDPENIDHWPHAINGAILGGFKDMLVVLCGLMDWEMKAKIRKGEVDGLYDPMKLCLNTKRPDYWKLLENLGVSHDHMQQEGYLKLVSAEKSDSFPMLQFLVSECDVDCGIPKSQKNDDDNIVINGAKTRNVKLLNFVYDHTPAKSVHRSFFIEHKSHEGLNVLTSCILGTSEGRNHGMGHNPRKQQSDTKNEDLVLEAVKFFVEKKAVVIDTDDASAGHCAVTCAAMCGFNKVVQYLVEVGKANVDQLAVGQGGEQYTALAWACETGNLELVKYFSQLGVMRASATIPLNLGNNTGTTTCLEMAVRRKHVKVVRYLNKDASQKVALNSTTQHLLVVALKAQAWDCVRYIINESGDPAFMDGNSEHVGNGPAAAGGPPVGNVVTPASTADEIKNAVEEQILTMWKDNRIQSDKELYPLMRELQRSNWFDSSKHASIASMLGAAGDDGAGAAGAATKELSAE